MRLRIPKPMYFIAFAGMALFMGSCAKNTTIIYGNGEDNLPETPQKETTLVTFNASVESRNLTRAMSPMKKRNQEHFVRLSKGTEYHQSGNSVCRRIVHHFLSGGIIRKRRV